MGYQNDEIAVIKQSFFKTDENEYAAGDKFLGVYIPEVKKIINTYIKQLTINDLVNLLSSKYNEIRYGALFAISKLYKTTNDTKYVDLYLKYIKYVNNWNLVDISAYNIIGKYAFDNNDLSIIKKFVKSNNLWLKRIAIVSMYYFIKRESFKLPKYIFIRLLNDEHHLIQKAIGWMLREIGKINKSDLISFLTKYRNQIKSITWNYATEHLSKTEKQNL